MAGRAPKFHPLIDAGLSTIARGALAPLAMAGYDRAARAADRLTDVYVRLDKKHMRRAMANLRDAFPHWDEDQIWQVARGCHHHLLQLGVEFAYTPRVLTPGAVARHLRFEDAGAALRPLLTGKPTILITGHIGNWELVGYAVSMLGFDMFAVYRPLDLRGMDAWLKQSRESKGLRLISKFGAARAVPAALEAGFPVGLVADQSGGDRGVFTPFFGRLTSTYKMIGLLAMRFGATVACGVARRMPAERSADGFAGLRYNVEVVDVFGPDDWKDQPDALYYITARYRRAMETMIRRSPEQYFWMHRIWRSRPAHERLGKPFPNSLREKMAGLPWMTSEDVESVVEQSARDVRELERLQRA